MQSRAKDLWRFEGNSRCRLGGRDGRTSGCVLEKMFNLGTGCGVGGPRTHRGRNIPYRAFWPGNRLLGNSYSAIHIRLYLKLVHLPSVHLSVRSTERAHSLWRTHPRIVVELGRAVRCHDRNDHHRLSPARTCDSSANLVGSQPPWTSASLVFQFPGEPEPQRLSIQYFSSHP